MSSRNLYVFCNGYFYESLSQKMTFKQVRIGRVLESKGYRQAGLQARFLSLPDFAETAL